MKKSAFTLVESLISLLIISAVGMAVVVFSSAYLKITFDRDVQMQTVLDNISTVEKLRAEVKTLPQLYEFSKDKEIKITAIGLGVINLSEDGTFSVAEPENNAFSDNLTANKNILFKIDVGGSIPNTKISTVVILR